jgi:ELWxxDGT repeat protein
MLPTPSAPGAITSLNGTTYFFALDGDRGEALWSRNGSGLQVIKDITPTLPVNVSAPVFLGSADLANLTSVGNSLYFTALNLGHPQIWKSDGTAAGTERVKEFAALVAPGDPYTAAAFGIQNLTAAGVTATFSAYDPPRGRQLWETNGTAGGTQPVPDTSSLNARQFADAATALFATGHPDLSLLPVVTPASTIAGANSPAGVYPLPHPAATPGKGPDGPFVLEMASESLYGPHPLLPAAVPSVDGPTSGVAIFQATQGQTYTGQVATLTAPANARGQAHYHALIDWGDGTTATAGEVYVQGSEVEVDGQHTYRQPGHFPIRVHVDLDGIPVGDLGGTATVVPPSRDQSQSGKDTPGKPGRHSGLVPAPDRAAGLSVTAAFLLPFFRESYEREDEMHLTTDFTDYTDKNRKVSSV